MSRNFLRSVARAYVEHEAPDALGTYCMVVPNRRSAMFLERALRSELAKVSPRPVILPEVVNIDSLMAQMVPRLAPATRYEQLFTLYEVYRDKLGEGAVEFDRFRYWGDLLLNDFNEIDRYLVDAAALLKNLRDLKRIQSTFITPEHRKVLEYYWGESMPPYYDTNGDDDAPFWAHTHAGEDVESKRLWAIMYDLYQGLHKALERQGLATDARLQRLAIQALKERGEKMLLAKRYVFVGFSFLTPVEKELMEQLDKLQMADFYWEPAAKALADNKGKDGSRTMALSSMAMTMIGRNVRRFKPRYDIDDEAEADTPEANRKIDIIGVPSRTGQALVATGRLDAWVKNKVITNPVDAINTAIVVPDQSLLETLVNNIPSELEKVNVTMGLAMRYTPMASLLRVIVSMHLRARIVKGEMCYFRDDMLGVVNHPLLHSVDSSECRKLVRYIDENRLFFIPYRLICEMAPTLKPIFAPVADTRNFDEVCTYINNVVAYLRDHFKLTATKGEKTHMGHATVVLEEYLRDLDDLRLAMQGHNIKMEEHTVFHMLESALAAAEIHLSGMPMQGVQVMGLLETRALDFDNLIILSLNERTFPRRGKQGSFIPQILRYYFMMPTADLRDATYMYHFYRLVGRASNTLLTYDARIEGGSSGEKSRYLTQLIYMPRVGFELSHTLATFQPAEQLPEVDEQDAEAPEPIDQYLIQLPKSPEIMRRLERFKTLGSGKNLSPSSINEYINCPLCFCLKYVMGINPPDDIVDYMNAADYGHIVHSVVEHLYKDRRRDPSSTDPVLVDEAMIEHLLSSQGRGHVRRLLVEYINREYRKLPDDKVMTPLQGDAYALAQILFRLVMGMIEQERQFVPFLFIDAERATPENYQLKIPGAPVVNYKHVIDRIDRVADRLRIVDYKTGGDKTTFTSIAKAFEQMQHRPKAILQLMLYCNVYAELDLDRDEPIQPMIYSMRKVLSEGLQPLKQGGNVVWDYHALNEEFIPLLSNTLREIFDPDVPFCQAPAKLKKSSCMFCKFKAICGRET